MKKTKKIVAGTMTAALVASALTPAITADAAAKTNAKQIKKVQTEHQDLMLWGSNTASKAKYDLRKVDQAVKEDIYAKWVKSADYKNFFAQWNKLTKADKATKEMVKVKAEYQAAKAYLKATQDVFSSYNAAKKVAKDVAQDPTKATSLTAKIEKADATLKGLKEDSKRVKYAKTKAASVKAFVTGAEELAAAKTVKEADKALETAKTAIGGYSATFVNELTAQHKVVVEKLAVAEVKSVKAITDKKVKVEFTSEVKDLTRDSFTIKNKETGEKQYIKAITVSEDKKSVEVELYDAMKTKTTYTVEANVAGEVSSAELNFVIGEVAQIVVKDQTIKANTDTAIKYQVLDANGLDITSSTKVSFASDKTITDGKINLAANTFAFVEISATKTDGTVVKSSRVKVTAEAAKAVELTKFTVDTKASVDFDKDTLTNKVSMGQNAAKIHTQLKDQFGELVTTASTFESLDKEVALVDRVTGTVTPLKEGKFAVRVTNGEFTKTIELEVVAAAKLGSLKVENATLNVTTVNTAGKVDIETLDQFGNKFVGAGEATVKVLSGTDFVTVADKITPNDSIYTLNVTAKAEGTAVIEVTIGSLKQNITVNVKKPGTVTGYKVNGFKTELDKIDDTNTTSVDETTMNLQVLPVDADGLATGAAENATVKVLDKDGKEVALSGSLTGTNITIDAKDAKLVAGETYTVKAFVNKLEVFSNAFTVKDSTKYPTLRLTGSTVNIDMGASDKTFETAVKEILEVTAPNGTIASNAKVMDVKFVSDNSAVITDAGATASEAKSDGKATVAIQEIKVDLDGDTTTTVDDQYTVKFVSNVNLVVKADANAAVKAELDAAKTAVEGAQYTLTFADHNTDAEAKAYVEGVVNGLTEVSGKGITATVNGTFTAADAGTSQKGSYVFTVELAKGGQTVTTTSKTLEIPFS